MDQNNFEKPHSAEAYKSDDDDDEEGDLSVEESKGHDEEDVREEDEKETQTDNSNYQIAKNSQFDSGEEPDGEPETLEESEEPEPEVASDELTPEESYTVVEEYVGERSAEVRREVEDAPAESPEEVAALADAVLLDEIREQLAVAGEGGEEVLDAAFDKVTSELELEDAIGPGEEEDPQTAQPNIVPPLPPTPNVPTPPTPNVPTPIPPIPPLPPTPTPPPPPPPRPGPLGPYRPWIPPPGPPLNPNVPTPNIGSPNTPNLPPPVPAAEIWQPRRSRAGDLLLGGIIGYMIGRRGGRKRTEKRLLPIQEKLEHEVKDLQFAVDLREQKIRQLAAEKVIAKPEAAPKMVEKLKNRVAAKEAARGKERTEKIVEKNTDIKFGKIALPSAEILPERRKITAENDGKPRVALEVMTVEQLLEVVAEAKVNNVSVKQMFEVGQINEFGLRRVAIEYLRGKHYEKVLSVYLLPDSGETIHQSLSPARALNVNRAGQITLEQNQATEPRLTPASSPEQSSRQFSSQPLPTLRKPPKIYPSVIGMAAGVVLALIIIIYLLIS